MPKIIELSKNLLIHKVQFIQCHDVIFFENIVKYFNKTLKL